MEQLSCHSPALLEVSGEQPRGSFHVSAHFSVQRPHQVLLVQGHERQQINHPGAALQQFLSVSGL